MSDRKIDYTKGGLRLAVVGGGISGIVAAHLLGRRNDVVIFERENRLGGHTYTVDAPQADGTTLPVDIGFIVFNEPNYPVFCRFIRELGVGHGDSDMSFAFHDPRSGFMYAGTGVAGLLARWRNILTPAFWRMLSSIPRFCREAREDLRAGNLTGITIDAYLRSKGYHRDFEENYLLPMTGAIWSAPEGKARDFPAEALVRFFDNHALLDYAKRPQWSYILNGSHSYVKAFQQSFPGEIRTGVPVRSVSRGKDGVTLGTTETEERFDAVVMATHADVTLSLLSDPDDREQRLLSPWSYAPNRVVLHTDEALLPPRKAARASWNFERDPARAEDAPVGVSYHMNRLQRIESMQQYIVSLNPVRAIESGSILEDVVLDHPQYSLAALATQSELPELDARRRTFFCGAYQGYGFHEDGARSGARVARHFGEEL